MKPNRNSQQLLGATRSKAKMYEYGVPEDHHITLYKDPARLFALTIGMLGDLSARINKDEKDQVALDELKINLLFAAHFFDSYLQAKLEPELESYLLFLGASSYYLCDLPGSSSVLINKLHECPDLNGSGLEELLYWLLKGEFTELSFQNSPYRELLVQISKDFISFWRNGRNPDALFLSSSELRDEIYISGTPRELLLSDIVGAIIKKRVENSTWTCLDRYTGISLNDWSSTLKKNSFIKELWPAQHLLGKSGIFAGESGIIQMPTSAGKTKAVEIIIRAAFLAERTSLAIIVAPFRALCHEIKNNFMESFEEEEVNINELTDVPFYDFDLETMLVGKQVLIVTPEKLLYVLRHTPELSDNVGLLIYDEGHQFDNGIRGITYELLLTSLRSMISNETQTVLISAVISNANAIGQWLIGERSLTVTGTNLIPTHRSLAFASWLDQLGRLEFVLESDPETNEFYVPRIIESNTLNKLGRERNERVFPEKNNGQDIALYLGLKLVSNGSVAIFAGRKSTTITISERVIDVYKRGLTFNTPNDVSDQDEVQKLCHLISSNLGENSIDALCSKMGVFIHHGNVPQGIRLSVEHALKEGMIKFVVCTSTLAQGVNLPIKYLIVTGIYQGSEKIKTRDFHNLIGRAGRAGMHTEGSIIFSDNNVYDKRRSRTESWRWQQSKEILNPEESEPCGSTLFTIFEPIYSQDKNYIIQTEPLEIIEKYYRSKDELNSFIEEIANEEGFNIEDVIRQIKFKIRTVSAIESFIMTHWNDFQEKNEQAVVKLSEGTLAYYLASEEEKQQIVQMFRLIAENVDTSVSNNENKQVFGRTLYGLEKTLDIFDWFNHNITSLISCENTEELIEVLWPLIYKHIENNIFRKCDQPATLKEICIDWIGGSNYSELYSIIVSSGMVIAANTRNRNIKLDHLIEICDNSLSYEGSLILGAVIEFIPLIQDEETDRLINLLELLQKEIKYGLPSKKSIIIYELGFSDRIVSKELANIIDKSCTFKHEVIRDLKQNGDVIKELLNHYPSYFQVILSQYLR